ncbi:MAG: FeoB-associated Cys-rich membrane protein [Candidatus Omnitrophica bacterium]|jgi:preprotein translocase subunit SecG|nr:FeoB-associated Cys-rich membrane protein [Candidatus Omnitrophota bacterium]
MEKIFILFIVLAAFIILIRMLIRNIKNGGCGTCAGGCASMSKKCKDKNK